MSNAANIRLTTTEDFVVHHGVTMTATRADRNPNMGDDEWSRSASHFKCVLRFEGRQLTTYFSQGSAHTNVPTVATVLDCLATDAGTAFSVGSFEEFCREFGYDDDSRRAERAYRACEAMSGKLERFLGAGLADFLLHEVERL